MRSNIIVVALSALAATVSSAAGDFSVDPYKIDNTTKADWCRGEYNTCGTLCGGTPNVNSCNATSLVFSCVCQNGSAPGLDYYENTIPTYICQEAFKECNLANVGNAAGQRNCTTAIQDHCGTLDSTKADTGGSSGGDSSSKTTATTASTTQGSSGAQSTSSPTSSSSKAAAPTNVQLLGNGAAAAALGLFAYML